MDWIPRTITECLQRVMGMFPAVLVTGPRQVGKSSLLRQVGEAFEYVTFDNPLLLQQAREDPALFLMSRSTRLILDEVQYVPELFPYLKIRIDEMRFAALNGRQAEECLYLLSGSQAYHLMQNVSESLAGRLAILPLLGISYRERSGNGCGLPFVPDQDYFSARKGGSIETTELWRMIHRGSMPRLVASQDDWELFYSSYVATYIERDVNQLSKISDKGDFVRLMAAVAARSGELLNMDSLARDTGISSETAKRWVRILETSGIILLLQPYHNNHLKRMIKTPKLYFLDTGLLAWLTRWITPETMMNGAKAGSFYETWVISEIVKSFLNAGRSVRDLYFYRDADQREIDLVMEVDRTLHPIEVKLSARPDRRMIRAFQQLKPVAEAGDRQIGEGAVICQYPEILSLDTGVRAVPTGWL